MQKKRRCKTECLSHRFRCVYSLQVMSVVWLVRTWKVPILKRKKQSQCFSQIVLKHKPVCSKESLPIVFLKANLVGYLSWSWWCWYFFVGLRQSLSSIFPAESSLLLHSYFVCKERKKSTLMEIGCNVCLSPHHPPSLFLCFLSFWFYQNVRLWFFLCLFVCLQVSLASCFAPPSSSCKWRRPS